MPKSLAQLLPRQASDCARISVNLSQLP